MIKKDIKKRLVYSPIKYSERMDAFLRLTLLKSWIRTYQPHPYFETREQMYNHIVENLIGNNTPISFLEFGVYEGDSIRYWANLNTNVKSEFTGFDSFEGLPEDWINVGGTIKKGSYSTNGDIPVNRDNRINFVKGWFQDTLPLFLKHFSTDKQIVIHCDADVYSSTMFVLCTLDALIKPGVIVLFDDFSSMLHDFRALEDYSRSFRRHYEVLGASGHIYYGNTAIRFTE